MTILPTSDSAECTTTDAKVDAKVLMTKTRAYLLGVVINGVPSGAVYTATRSQDGLTVSWDPVHPLPRGHFTQLTFVTSHRVYVLASRLDDPETKYVYTAEISADGVLGEWETCPDLPESLYKVQVFSVQDRAYVIGSGRRASDTLFTYSAALRDGGRLGDWVVSTGTHPLINRYTTHPATIAA